MKRKPLKLATRSTTALVAPTASATLVKRSARSELERGTTERDEPLTRHETRIVYGPGEPLRIEGQYRDSRGRPRSIWTAIVRMPKAQRELIGLELYELTRERDRGQLMGECVLYDAQDVDRVTVTRKAGVIVKWSVWLDDAGKHRIEVWP